MRIRFRRALKSHTLPTLKVAGINKKISHLTTNCRAHSSMMLMMLRFDGISIKVCFISSQVELDGNAVIKMRCVMRKAINYLHIMHFDTRSQSRYCLSFSLKLLFNNTFTDLSSARLSLQQLFRSESYRIGCMTTIINYKIYPVSSLCVSFTFRF